MQGMIDNGNQNGSNFRTRYIYFRKQVKVLSFFFQLSFICSIVTFCFTKIVFGVLLLQQVFLFYYHIANHQDKYYSTNNIPRPWKQIFQWKLSIILLAILSAFILYNIYYTIVTLFYVSDFEEYSIYQRYLANTFHNQKIEISLGFQILSFLLQVMLSYQYYFRRKENNNINIAETSIPHLLKKLLVPNLPGIIHQNNNECAICLDQFVAAINENISIKQLQLQQNNKPSSHEEDQKIENHHLQQSCQTGMENSKIADDNIASMKYNLPLIISQLDKILEQSPQKIESSPIKQIEYSPEQLLKSSRCSKLDIFEKGFLMNSKNLSYRQNYLNQNLWITQKKHFGDISVCAEIESNKNITERKSLKDIQSQNVTGILLNIQDNNLKINESQFMNCNQNQSNHQNCDSIIHKNNLENREENQKQDNQKINSSVEVIQLSCKHLFHFECILKWIESGHQECPICRQNICLQQQQQQS